MYDCIEDQWNYIYYIEYMREAIDYTIIIVGRLHYISPTIKSKSR
jgi:hypothetical protein